MQTNLLQRLLPSLTWRIPVKENVLFLTFDDGPVPEATPWVLDELKKYRAKATFFCVGENVKKHPDIYSRILAEGHAAGNHTYRHLNGWMNTNRTYFRDVEACRREVDSPLFRPPYGKIRLSQASALRKHYRIVMWDVLSKDYDPTLSGEECFQRVKRGAVPGSVIVFHDSIKAKERLFHALPETLRHFSERSYRFEKIHPAFLR